MSNTGNPDPPAARIPWLVLILVVLALILALYIGTQVIGVLFGIASPPEPPLPGGAQEISHSSREHGLDDWVYASHQNACEVVDFLRESGGVCEVDPVWCFDGGNLTPRPGSGKQRVASCSADTKFSIFAMRWQAIITAGYSADGQTRLEISREISWSGSLPPENP
jgi:hypothetical protein